MPLGCDRYPLMAKDIFVEIHEHPSRELFEVMKNARASELVDRVLAQIAALQSSFAPADRTSKDFDLAFKGIPAPKK